MKIAFKLFILLMIAGLSFSQNACKSGEKKGEDSTTVQTGKFGKEFDNMAAISVPDMIKKMDTMSKMDCVIKGKIATVCQAEGCWLRVESTEGNTMFMNWDHQFFVPKDAAGKTVYANGYAYVSTTSVEKLKHFAQDEGKSKEDIDAITEPKSELKFEATGVVIE